MQAKQYLDQLRTIKRRIDGKRRDAEMWRSVASGLGGMREGEHVQSSSAPDKLASAIARAVDCERDAINLAVKLIALQETIIQQIDDMPNPTHSLVLSEYYVHEMSVPEIAEEWDKSCRHVIRVKNDAIREFSQKYVDNSPQKT